MSLSIGIFDTVINYVIDCLVYFIAVSRASACALFPCRRKKLSLILSRASGNSFLTILAISLFKSTVS